MLYDDLVREAVQHGIDLYEKPLKPTIKGLYADGVIWINRRIPTRAEKACILAEELGHYHTTTGDITDQSKTGNRKQEARARTWAYERLVPLPKIVQAYRDRVRNRHELAEYLGVTEAFLQEALSRYRERYGPFKTIGHVTICFEPLGILEMLED